MNRSLGAALISGALLFAACDSDATTSADVVEDATTTSEDATTTTEDATVEDTVEDSAEDTAEPVDRSNLGQDVDRPARVVVPRDYDASVSYPLVTLLHGYSATGAIQDIYFGLSNQVNARNFILIIPDGLKDGSGNQYWNATDACCDFAASGVDDVGYLWGLVEEAQGRYNIDTKQISFIGHSNGGFMSHRMACEHGDKIAAIVSLAGSTFSNADDCANAGQVSALQIHGESDTTIFYAGGSNIGGSYPGARETIGRWATQDGCNDPPIAGPKLDIETSIAGEDTLTESWSGCAEGREVSLWTIENGSHIPNLGPTFTQLTLDFMFDHPRP